MSKKEKNRDKCAQKVYRMKLKVNEPNAMDVSVATAMAHNAELV